MLDLARVWRQMGRARESTALVLAASRSASARLAEDARELLPNRYPYPYEFEDALKLDAGNRDLRREYAFLLLAMGRTAEARAQFELLLKQFPNDRVSAEQLRMLQNAAPTGTSTNLAPAPDAITAKELGLKSYHRGYLQDALRYLEAAWEERPGDAEVALQLGWTLNLLHRDREALAWFDRAQQSGVDGIAREANHASRNLRAARRGVRLTVWALPMYSSRWDTTFVYSQAKLEFVNWKRWGFQPYASLRWAGDTRLRTAPTGDAPGAMLSDSAFIAAAGVNRRISARLFVWAEAGRAFSYLGDNPASGAGQTDLRGGASYLRGWGATALAGEGGWFTEAGADGVYLSRYDHNSLLYLQARRGVTLPPWHGSAHVQPYWNFDLTADAKRQWWGNYAESGPGVRLRWDSLPPNLSFRADYLRGVYLVNASNPHRPNYWDVRASLWYAVTR
jgi:tetratricopeptide (TPR) repeat protein